MISPLRLRTADLASRRARPPLKQRNCPQIRASFAREPRKEKDPGSAFGPESVPLATGLVPVVYWVPGPFPGPTPRPAGYSRQALPDGPDLISLPVWLASLVLD